MNRKWILIPAISLGMLALGMNDIRAQRGGDKGGSRGMPSPDEIWARYGGGAGDTIDLNKNPQVAMMIKMKGYSVPQDGILRKDQFMPQVAARIQGMSGGSGPPATGGPPPSSTGGGDKPAVILVPGEEPQGSPPGGSSRGGPPSGGDKSSDRGSDRGSDRSKGSSSGSGWGGSRGGDEGKRVEDPDDERPNVLRYGKTPKELPGWFTELDSDKDAQIGLYEWRAAGMSIEEFLEKDLNSDGFLTADEVLKNPKSGATSEAKSDSKGNPYSSRSGSSSSNDQKSGSSNDSSKSKDKNEKDKSDSKSSKEEKKPAESSGSNPFLKK